MSTPTLNRRHWLKSSLLLAGGAAIAPQVLSAKPRIKPLYPPQLWERNFQFPPDFSKLNARLLANENPYGPSDKVRLAIMESVGMGNRYGHQDAQKLKAMLAEKEGVTPDHILLGPGSTDILEKTAIVQFIEGGNIVSADPSYMSLVKTAMAFGADWKNIPLTADYAHDLSAMAAAVDDETKLIYVCNPNNPMGSLTPTKDLWDFCAKVSKKAPVFVDEAYLEFLDAPAASSMVGLVAEGKDIIVARTFSKIHGMAGLRIGYGVALPETLEKITGMVRSNMGLSVTSLRGAMASLEATDFQEKTRKLTAETREYVAAELEKLGFAYVPSHTSFMIFPIELPGDQYLEKMFAQGIGIRVFEIDDKPWCRVSMGTMQEMEMFIEALKNVVG
ncbi:MAG: aminotransferase class I/II-fold pyridoxal phosphate-dependent enzyme [Bacteroidota bacterium]